MRRITLVIVVLLIIGCSVWFFLHKKNISPQKKIQTSAQTLPRLVVKGNTIVRSDTGSPVQLKGVSTMNFANGLNSPKIIMPRLNEVKKWNINLLGIYVNPKGLASKKLDRRAMLDRVVTWAKENKIYVFLIPATLPQDMQMDVKDEMALFEPLMDELSTRYKNEQHVLYGLWAEPRGIEWEQWVAIAEKMTDIIRKNDPAAVIIMSGVGYGRIYRTNPIFKKPNTVYSFHDYPWKNKEDQRAKPFVTPMVLWEEPKKHVPILISEWGGFYDSDFGTVEDVDYIKHVLKEINTNTFSYCAYAIDDEGPELSLIDWNTKKPTRKGQVIKQDLINFPPTGF